MKLLMCGPCGEIRSPSRDGAWTWCNCGSCAMRWTDPTRGTAEVWADDRARVRVIGIDNRVLNLSWDSDSHILNHTEWREAHRVATETADGYVFAADKRGCWMAVVRVGETNDIRWAQNRPPEPLR